MSIVLTDAPEKQKATTSDDPCVQCGAGPDRRKPSGGFGDIHPTCKQCGYVWTDEVWRG